MCSPESHNLTPHAELRFLCGVFLLVAAVLMGSPARGQATDFSRDCMRVSHQGLILETSTACIAAFRSDPSARAQFVQLIQSTLKQVGSGRLEAHVEGASAGSVRRLHDKASMEPGRVVGVGGSYYGAQ